MLSFGAKPADIKAKAVAELSAVSALLANKAPADAVAYKTWLACIAKAVAEAAPESGFLGFGGTQVSDAEKATARQRSASRHPLCSRGRWPWAGLCHVAARRARSIDASGIVKPLWQGADMTVRSSQKMCCVPLP